MVCVVFRLLAGRSGVRMTAGARDYSLLQNVQPGCGAHPASYSLPGVNRPGREVDHSSCSDEAKNDWSSASASPPPICLYGVARNSFTSFCV